MASYVRLARTHTPFTWRRPASWSSAAPNGGWGAAVTPVSRPAFRHLLSAATAAAAVGPAAAVAGPAAGRATAATVAGRPAAAPAGAAAAE